MDLIPFAWPAGVSAMVVLAELTLHLYREKGTSLVEHMDDLYSKYGFFCSRNGYYSMPDPGVASTILDRIRSKGRTYEVLKQSVERLDRSVVWFRDLGHPGYDSTRPDQNYTPVMSNSAPLLTIKLSSGCLVQLRPSGTEPKFKYYLEMQGTPGMPREDVQEELDFVEGYLLDKLLEPSVNGSDCDDMK